MGFKGKNKHILLVMLIALFLIVVGCSNDSKKTDGESDSNNQANQSETDNTNDDATNDEEEEEYAKAFPNSYKVGDGIIVNGIGVSPIRIKMGIATLMLEFGKKYALEHGFTKFIGTIHPKNDASAGALSHIAEMEKGDPFIHETRDGRDLLRQYFIQNLK